MFSHPSNVCMTYFTHFKFALLVGLKLYIGGLKSIIHAVLPDLFITSTTDLINELDEMLKNSGCRKDN